MKFRRDNDILFVPEKNETLFRYMDIPTFLDLITSNELAFSRVDIQEDKFEGEILSSVYSFYIESYKRLPPSVQNIDFKRKLEFDKYSLRSSSYISCWCASENLNFHMWKIFSKQYGIAIETDIDLLEESIDHYDEIYITKVKYIRSLDDDSLEGKRPITLLQPLAFKSKGFENEKEIRLIIDTPIEYTENPKLQFGEGILDSEKIIEFLKSKPIYKVKIDSKKMIKNVFLSPFAPDWYADFLNKILINLGFNLQVIIKKNDFI